MQIEITISRDNGTVVHSQLFDARVAKAAWSAVPAVIEEGMAFYGYTIIPCVGPYDPPCEPDAVLNAR